MTTQKCAVVNTTSNLVVNVIIADPTSFTSPAGCILVGSATANIGDSYSGGAIIPAPVPTPPPLTKAQANALIQSQIQQLESTQQRSLREIAMGNGSVTFTLNGVTTTAVAQLTIIDTQIASLRAQLQS